MLHQKPCSYTPKQDSVIECKHRHCVETLISLHHNASLPSTFLVKILTMINYLINHMPKRSLHHQSPYEALYNYLPDYSHLKVSGYLPYSCLRQELTLKLHHIPSNVFS